MSETNQSIIAAATHAVALAGYALDHIKGLGAHVDGASFLELGPGNNFGTSLIIAGLGARCAVADRFLHSWDPSYHPAFYEELRRLWGAPCAPLDAVLDRGGYEGVLAMHLEWAEELDSVPNESVDIVYSNAVLEHVMDLPQACREVFRVTRPGGVNSHQVDFRFHGNFDRPLDHLIGDESAAAAFIASTNGEKGTRWRPVEARQFLRGAGFEILDEEHNGFATDEYLADVAPRLRASGSRYGRWPVDELRLTGVRFMLRRPRNQLSAS